jgi:TolB-like protein
MFYALSSMLIVFSLLLLATSISYAAKPEQKLNIALFPFENFTQDRNALTSVMPVLRDRLEARGLDVLNEDSLNRFLLKERIRSTGYISRDIARKIRDELNVQVILVGSVNSFFPGENPRVGFSARLINSSDGSILWANHASATGEDFTTVLGLGKVRTIDRLISKVMDKLLGSFSISPHYKEIESTYRIAVMPFQNKSKIRDAGMIATYMFLVELFKNQRFQPVEYGEVRRLTVDLRVRGKGELDLKNTETISKSLGADGILVGTVELYNEGEGTLPPEVIISARLIDARKNRILWYDGYQYNGDEGIIILDWGRIRSAENVAYKAVSKLLKEMSKAKWQ